MQEELARIQRSASSLILGAESLEELNQVKLDFLGKSGQLTHALKGLPKVSETERPALGRLANEIKNSLESLIETREKELGSAAREAARGKYLDVTLPGKVAEPLGHLHLVTQTIEEITSIFEKIGFVRRRYPEVEWDYYAFEALNFPESHPARDDWETFFIEEDANPKYGPMLLTPHTSSGQIREMERTKPPIKMLNIAKCYRRQSDVSHAVMFHQFETLYVDKNVSITHLKGVLDYFAKSFFGEDRQTRIRPYHFQFTEPSFEVDITCGVCHGAGCKLCKGGWLELGGAGMVHPNVLKNAGINPHEYNGFASGWGVERVLMMREGIELPDLRMIYSTNLDFLQQF